MEGVDAPFFLLLGGLRLSSLIIGFLSGLSSTISLQAGQICSFLAGFECCLSTKTAIVNWNQCRRTSSSISSSLPSISWIRVTRRIKSSVLAFVCS